MLVREQLLAHCGRILSDSHNRHLKHVHVLLDLLVLDKVLLNCLELDVHLPLK